MGTQRHAFPHDFCVLDLETTGLMPNRNHILEVGIIKVRNRKIVDTYQSFFRYEKPVRKFISDLTGITSSMVCNAPLPEDVLRDVKGFVGDDWIMGYNTPFDIRFLYDQSLIYLNEPFVNDYVDVMRLVKSFYYLENYKLGTVASSLGLNTSGAHRALFDCEMTLACFNHLYEKMIQKYGSSEAFSRHYSC